MLLLEPVIVSLTPPKFTVSVEEIIKIFCKGNEGYIGEALSESLPKHGLKREDVIITTKISPANQGREKSAASIEK